MTIKEIEKKLREAADKLDKHIEERRAETLARVFERINEKKG